MSTERVDFYSFFRHNIGIMTYRITAAILTLDRPGRRYQLDGRRCCRYVSCVKRSLADTIIKYVKYVTLALLGLLAMFAGSCTLCVIFRIDLIGMCAATVAKTALSPDGKARAILYERDCGATDDFHTFVTIRDADDELPRRPARAPTYFFAADAGANSVVAEGNVINVELHWTEPDALLVRYDSSAEVYVAENSFGRWPTYKIAYEAVAAEQLLKKPPAH